MRLEGDADDGPTLVYEVMTRLMVILLLTLLLPQSASAKRIAPKKVDPVIYEGVRYVAPNDDGRRGYIEAWNVGTDKKLWELTLFTNRIDPKLRKTFNGSSSMH